MGGCFVRHLLRHAARRQGGDGPLREESGSPEGRTGSFPATFAENSVLRFYVRITHELHTMNTSTVSSHANEFAGKRVLVTGGTKGAGKAIADRFRLGGATVIITARSAPTQEADNHFIRADVSTAEGTTKVINEILNRFQGIDI